VFGLFIWVRLVELEGRPLDLNLAPHHETAVRLLGAGRYYLLEWGGCGMWAKETGNKGLDLRGLHLHR
jgi:hypothetical protein